ncbi:hypothetical protein TNCV_3095131 [Trichonephila clavipes]|nr:hypothetical protein TNCV_3095131 [Trichonephila clavipes]
MAFEVVHPLITSPPQQRENVLASIYSTTPASLQGGSSAVQCSNSRHAGQDSVTCTTRLPRPSATEDQMNVKFVEV